MRSFNCHYQLPHARTLEGPRRPPHGRVQPVQHLRGELALEDRQRGEAAQGRPKAAGAGGHDLQALPGSVASLENLALVYLHSDQTFYNNCLQDTFSPSNLLLVEVRPLFLATSALGVNPAANLFRSVFRLVDPTIERHKTLLEVRTACPLKLSNAYLH